MQHANTGIVSLVGDERLDAVRLALFVGEVNVAFKHSSDGCSRLLVDGVEFTELQAILRYVGRRTGSYPIDSPTAALRVDEILHALSEVEAKVAFMSSDLQVTSTLSRYGKLFDARLELLKDDPILEPYAGKLLIHEFALYSWSKATTKMGFNAEGYQNLHRVVSRVEIDPKVKRWNELQQRRAKPKLKLTYFPFPGRAEPIRLALFIGGIEFEDERIGVDELNRRRPSLPFNQLPVLEVDGEMVSQALAILRYVGTLSGLYSPSDFLESFRIDEVFSLIDEFYSSYTWNASYFEKDPVRQLELRTQLAEETLPKTLGFLEKRVFKWGGTYSVGEKFTVADLTIYSLLWTFQSGRIAGVPVSVVLPYQNLLKVYQTVSMHPKVLEWSTMSH